MQIRKGEVWKIDGRKGPLTVKVLQDVESDSEDFFTAKIIEGTVRYLSMENNFYQRVDGQGTPGHCIELRASLYRFLEKVT